MTGRTPVVLTNGTWHGSWCWSLVIPHLSAAGTPAASVELEGFGGLRGFWAASGRTRVFDEAAMLSRRSPLAEITLSSAADALVADLRAIAGHETCLLVAHSLGAAVATAAAEAAPELVAGLVYVSGLVPVNGLPAGAYNDTEEMRDSLLPANFVADPFVIGALRGDMLDPSRRAHAKRTFYNDVDDTLAEAALSMLSTDAPLGPGLEPVSATRERFGSIPHTYVLCLRDNAIRPALQRRLITEIDAVSAAPTTVIELDTSHSPFLSRPRELAEIINGANRGSY
jgi:pimeloyl-ACP methyl ester carboxylesterase